MAERGGMITKHSPFFLDVCWYAVGTRHRRFPQLFICDAVAPIRKVFVMKKILALLILLCIAFNFCGCWNDDLTDPGHHTTETEATSQDESETTTEKSGRINQSTVIAEENKVKTEYGKIITGEKDETSPSGYMALEKTDYPVPSSETTLSVERIAHSHGPAADGKAHHSVVEAQELFDKYGAFALDTQSESKVLYLTFDCGYEYENLTSKILDTLKEKEVTAAFFSTLDHMKNQPELIARMIREGHIVGNHSTTHPDFTTISREEIVTEIETTENYLRENFGYTAKFFRFPTGAYSESTLEVVSDMGYSSVFWSVAYDDWDTKNIRGKAYTLEKVMSRLHDGAIILLHGVSRDNADALGDIIDKAREQGYSFRALTELVGG